MKKDDRRRSAPWGSWRDRSETLSLHPSNWRIPGRIAAAWVNQVMSVQISYEETQVGQMTHLWVRRHDGRPVLWAEMQRVKNELVGPERVGVEVFPAETNLVDVAPMYHLWIYPEGYQLPFSL
jgi:hypothetical protein